jgi:hypothetical protein
MKLLEDSPQLKTDEFELTRVTRTEPYPCTLKSESE